MEVAWSLVGDLFFSSKSLYLTAISKAASCALAMNCGIVDNFLGQQQPPHARLAFLFALFEPRAAACLLSSKASCCSALRLRYGELRHQPKRSNCLRFFFCLLIFFSLFVRPASVTARQ
jgi:hypothetical protein